MGQKNVVIDWDLPTFEEQLLTDNPTLAAAAEAEARAEMHQWLSALAAAADDRLSRREHLRTRSGALITTFDQWLLAVECILNEAEGRGEWPG